MSDSAATRLDRAALQAANRIDQVCDVFEQAWRDGAPPQIEEFLQETALPERSTLLLELVRLDAYYRLRQGDTPRLEDYAARFPEYAGHLSGAELDETFRDGRAAETAAAPAFGRFERLEQLGTGAFGTVWKARDPKLDRIVALKLPCTESLDDADGRVFLREARAAARLRHPNIVAVHEVGREGKTAYIASEFIDGPDLKGWLKQNRPDFDTAARLCLKLAEALQHAHEQGIVHRDLKPANIVLDRSGEPHITDFGLAKRLAADATVTADGQVLGTPAYMSPEQAAGRSRDVDARSDIYSLGVILYELLTGRRPFAGDQQDVLRQVLSAEPPAPRSLRKEIPPDLATVCLKAMAKEPGQRYATTAQLATDLHCILESQPVRTKRPRAEHKPGLWTRRRFSAAGLAAPLLGYWAWNSLTIRPAPGSRRVVMDTKPSGAAVWFIPLSDVTGEPLPDRIIDAGASPVDVYLEPGDYLVEAVLDDQRFHEVYRHVPDESETLRAGWSHLFSKEVEDHRIALPAVRIVASVVARKMALVPGSPSFRMGRNLSRVIPAHTRVIPSFYIDPREFTFGEYKQINDGGLPRHYRDGLHPDDHAVPLTFDNAMSVAELLGKRLPHEAEFEYVATEQGQRDHPLWLDKFRALQQVEGFGAVGNLELDQVNIDPNVPIFGLCSNVAEWTITWPVHYPVSRATTRRFASPGDYRIVRGGNPVVADGSPEVTLSTRDPRARHLIWRYASKPGVGLRCTRSVHPRLSASDFAR